MADQALPSPDILRQLLHYDPDTGALIWRKRISDPRWSRRWAGQPALSSQHPEGYLKGAIFARHVLAHRVAFAMYHDRWPTLVDHINGMRSDNRIANLREVSLSENRMNSKRPVTNTSGHMGVSLCKATGEWWACIRVGGVTMSLGYFKDKSDALAAREAAEKMHGFHENHGRG